MRERKTGQIAYFLLAVALFLLPAPALGAPEIPITGCTAISAPGTYYLANDVGGFRYYPSVTQYACILINSSSVTFDCRGKRITNLMQSTSPRGILATPPLSSGPSSVSNVVVKNCPLIQGYYAGIAGFRTFGLDVANVTLVRNTFGISFDQSSECGVTGVNSSENTNYGLSLQASSSCNATLSAFNYNQKSGVQLSNTKNSTITGNSLKGNYVSAVLFSGSAGNSVYCNNVKGNPYTISGQVLDDTSRIGRCSGEINSCGEIAFPGDYWLNATLRGSFNHSTLVGTSANCTFTKSASECNQTFAREDAATCIAITASNVTLDCKGNGILGGTGDYYGIYVRSDLDSEISDVKIRGCSKIANYEFSGLACGNCVHFSMEGSRIEGASVGALLTDSSDSEISTSTFADQGFIGIDIIGGKGNRIVRSTISNSSTYGVWVFNTSRTEILENVFRDSYRDLILSYTNETEVRCNKFSGDLRERIELSNTKDDFSLADKCYSDTTGTILGSYSNKDRKVIAAVFDKARGKIFALASAGGRKYAVSRIDSASLAEDSSIVLDNFAEDSETYYRLGESPDSVYLASGRGVYKVSKDSLTGLLAYVWKEGETLETSLLPVAVNSRNAFVAEGQNIRAFWRNNPSSGLAGTVPLALVGPSALAATDERLFALTESPGNGLGISFFDASSLENRGFERLRYLGETSGMRYLGMLPEYGVSFERGSNVANFFLPGNPAAQGNITFTYYSGEKDSLSDAYSAQGLVYFSLSGGKVKRGHANLTLIGTTEINFPREGITADSLGVPDDISQIAGIDKENDIGYFVTKFGKIYSVKLGTSQSTSPCSCSGWSEVECGTSSCPAGYGRRERSCSPINCAETRECILETLCKDFVTTSTTSTSTTTTTTTIRPNVTTTSIPSNGTLGNSTNLTTTTTSLVLSCPDSCDDQNPCTAESCSNETGFVCAYQTHPDGTTCGENFKCKEGYCLERECPPCPLPSEWGSCVANFRERAVYLCGNSTGYSCKKTFEKEPCEMPSTTTVPKPSCYSSDECAYDQVCASGKCQNAKLILLFIPLNWGGTLSEFSAEAEKQARFFLGSTPLANCMDSVKVIKSQNRCSANITCRSCAETLQITSCARKETSRYDYAIGLTDEGSTCGAALGGFSCKMGSVFVKKGSQVVLAHELGHEFGLKDEYCEYGTVCGSKASPNPLSYEYGCDPLKTDCCWCSGSYSVCCHGNKNAFGGRSIMSHISAPAPRAFDEPSLAHLKNNPKLRC